MKILMLDTNVVLDIFYNEMKALEKLRDNIDYQFSISYPVYIEVMAGSQLKHKNDTRKFLKKFSVISFDAKAQKQGELFSLKYFTGRENKPMDLMIAAHAKSLNMPIITNNAKDFIFKEVQVFYYAK